MKNMLKNNLKIMRKIGILSLVFLHILSLSPVRDALAYNAESANYKLRSSIANGSSDRSSTIYSLTMEGIGEPSVGIAQSANYRITSGFAAALANDPPEFIGMIANQSWPKNEPLMAAFDLDDYFQSELELTYTAFDNTLIGVDIDPATNIVSFTQPDAYYGTEMIYFIATDTDGNEVSSNDIMLQVLNINNPPILDPIADIAGSEGDLITITPYATDTDSDIITYSFSEPFDANGQWQTDFHDGDGGSCTYIVTVTATDKDGSISRDVDITINNVNRPPVIEPIGYLFGEENALVRIEPQVMDADGEPFEVWYSEPFGESGTWLPSYEDAGTYTVIITVSDGIDTVTESAELTISNVNRPPVAGLTLSSYTLEPNEEFQLTLTATDPDNDALSFVITRDGVEIASDVITSTYRMPLSISDIGDHTIEATVTDNGTPEALSVADTKGLNVIDPNADRDAITPLMGDFNGDCLTDVGFHDINLGTWEVSISNSGTFISTSCWLIDFGTSRDWIPISGDFDGDAITDIGIYNNTTDATDGGKCKIALSTGSGFNISGEWTKFTESSYDWQPFTGDFNIDKYTDLGVYNKKTGEARIAFSDGNSFGEFQAWITEFGGDGHSLFTGDFNGDGLPDICTFEKSTGKWQVAFNNSEGFVDSAEWIASYAKDKDPLVADFNNDGLTDIGYWDKDTNQWHYAISGGDRFIDKGVWYTEFGDSVDEYAYVGDFDGDSITNPALFDMDEYGIDKWTIDTSAGDFSSNPTKPDLLVGIYNGTGGATHITYQEVAGGAHTFLPFPVYVATEIRLIDMLPADSAQETYLQRFIYENGYFDAVEREFRGFGKVTVTDDITGNFTESFFYQGLDSQDAALKGRIEKIFAYDGNRQKISEVINTWSVRKSGPSDGVLGFPYLEKVNTRVWERGIPLDAENEFIYDNLGNVIKVTNKGDINIANDEKIAQTVFAPAYEEGHNRPIQTTLKDSNETIITKKNFEYDYSGNLTRETAWLNTDPNNGPSVSYSYDTYGNLISTQNPNGRSVYTSYESAYHIFPETITNELGHTIQYKYNPIFGAVEEVTDTNGYKTTSVYDSYGRIIQLKNPDNEVVTTYSYPDFNTKVTTQLNLVSTEHVDGIGRGYKSVTSGDDNGAKRDIIKEVFYNNRGLVDYEVLPYYSGETPRAFIRYEYDLRGRTISTTADYEGTMLDATSFTNYISALEVETINAKGQKKLTRKDVYGNIIEVTEYNGSMGTYRTYYTYDIQGNLKEVTDAQDNHTYINYDSLGRKSDMTDPDMGHWSYVYDSMGNLMSQTDAKGQVINFEYDGLSRLVKKSSLRAEGEAISTLASYEYDNPAMTNSTGRLSKVTDKQGNTTTYNYDKGGRITSSTAVIDSVSYTTSTTYDILGRVKSVTYPDAETVDYAYNSNSGQLRSLRAEGEAIPYIQDITYNQMGQIERLSYGNDMYTDYTYHNDFKLQNLRTLPTSSSAPIQDLNYTFDKAGNITTLTDNIKSNIRQFAYDDLNRLTQAYNVPSKTGRYQDITYQYDSIGNMTYKSDLGMFSYGSGAGPHAVTRAGGYSYTYDANGNQTYGRSRSMSYDVENHLVQVDAPSGEVNFEYDADGSRIRKIEGEDTVTYVSASYEVRKTDGVEKIVKHLFTGSDRSITIEKVNDQSHVYYHHNDHLGSTSLVTDENGYLVQECEYTPFGQVATNSGTFNSPYLFTGKELDSGTELYYYGARYYDPVLCHFTQADTLVAHPLDPQDYNRYAYCRNNPLIYTDPTGHSWFSKFFKKVGDFFKDIGDSIEDSFNLLIHKPGRWLAGNAGFVASFFITGGNPILMGIISGAWSGGYYAEQAGGNILQGALFGAAAGAITGYLGDKAANLLKSQLGPTTGTFTASNLVKGSLITGAEFGITDAGRGMAAGYAGGKGSFSDIMQGGLRGAYQGAITGAIVGGTYGTGLQKAFHGNNLTVAATPLLAPTYNELSIGIGQKFRKFATAMLYILQLLVKGRDPTPPDKVAYDRKPRKSNTVISRTTDYNPETNLKNFMNIYGP